ncbi:hypothetical protein ACLMJK_007759 [Lecanora helva]
MAGSRLLLSILFIQTAWGYLNATLSKARLNSTSVSLTKTSDCKPKTKTATKTYCPPGTPPYLYPFSYLPCESCSAYVVTDLFQTVTSAAVISGTTTKYVAPFWDFNFQPTKTVTVYVDLPSQSDGQVQIWRANQPKFQDNAVYQYENIIEYVVQDGSNGMQSGMTTTITSTVISTCSNTQPTDTPPFPTGEGSGGKQQSGQSSDANAESDNGAGNQAQPESQQQSGQGTGTNAQFNNGAANQAQPASQQQSGQDPGANAESNNGAGNQAQQASQQQPGQGTGTNAEFNNGVGDSAQPASQQQGAQNSGKGVSAPSDQQAPKQQGAQNLGGQSGISDQQVSGQQADRNPTGGAPKLRFGGSGLSASQQAGPNSAGGEAGAGLGQSISAGNVNQPAFQNSPTAFTKNMAQQANENPLGGTSPTAIASSDALLPTSRSSNGLTGSSALSVSAQEAASEARASSNIQNAGSSRSEISNGLPTSTTRNSGNRFGPNVPDPNQSLDDLSTSAPDQNSASSAGPSGKATTPSGSELPSFTGSNNIFSMFTGSHSSILPTTLRTDTSAKSQDSASGNQTSSLPFGDTSVFISGSSLPTTFEASRSSLSSLSSAESGSRFASSSSILSDFGTSLVDQSSRSNRISSSSPPFSLLGTSSSPVGSASPSGSSQSLGSSSSTSNSQNGASPQGGSSTAASSNIINPEISSSSASSLSLRPSISSTVSGGSTTSVSNTASGSSTPASSNVINTGSSSSSSLSASISSTTSGGNAPGSSDVVSSALSSPSTTTAAATSVSSSISDILTSPVPASITPTPATSDNADATSSLPASSASASGEAQTFQLYIKNDVPGLNALPLGESGDPNEGQLIVGGVDEATMPSLRASR